MQAKSVLLIEVNCIKYLVPEGLGYVLAHWNKGYLSEIQKQILITGIRSVV